MGVYEITYASTDVLMVAPISDRKAVFSRYQIPTRP